MLPKSDMMLRHWINKIVSAPVIRFQDGKYRAARAKDDSPPKMAQKQAPAVI